MAIPNEPIPQGTGSGGSPRRQDTILRDRPTQTRNNKTAQDLEISHLKKRVKRLEKKRKSRTLQLKRRLFKDVEIQGRYRHDMEFDYNLDTVEKDVNTAELVSTGGAAVPTDSVAVSTLSPTRNIRVSTVADITMAETLVCIRKSMVREASGLPEISHFRWQPKTKRIAMVHESARSFNVEEWEDIQARVKADEELVQRAKEKRNKPPTQAQQRTYMSNYIKNVEGYTLKQLRGYSFDDIKTLFETTMRRLNTFDSIESEVDKVVPELAVRSSKGDVEEELDQESSKKQKTGESLELAEEPRDKEADKLS
uniref:Uncharacterized protein n=1 Tax=Tanacetum cinerariifolium TaxID=118510 RepID=A0A6L2NU73_TANCI|nr:hypothetical protein [Tanacetum cinerariifolium]